MAEFTGVSYSNSFGPSLDNSSAGLNLNPFGNTYFVQTVDSYLTNKNCIAIAYREPNLRERYFQR